MKKVISIIIILTLVFTLVPNFLTYGVLENIEITNKLKLEKYNMQEGDLPFFTYDDVHDAEGKPMNINTEGNEFILENMLEDTEGTMFDIQGRVNGAWQSTTYSDFGYYTVIKVNNNKPRLYNETANNYYGVTLDLSAEAINNGNYFKIKYKVKNNNTENANISLGGLADVQICNNDDATIERMNNNTGLKLYDSDEDVQFTFYGRNVAGVTNIDNLWVGIYPDHETNYFNGNTRTKLEGKDSSFTYSWTNRELKPGEEEEYSVLIGIGKITNPPVIELINDSGDVYPTNEVVVEARVTDVDEDSIETIFYSVDDGTERVLETKRLVNNKYDFSIDLTNENFEDDSEHLLKIWAIDESGNPSNIEEKNIIISTLNAPEIEMSEEWTKEDRYFKVLDTKNNSAIIKKYQYKIEDGEWKDIELDQSTLALDETGAKKVYAKAISIADKESTTVYKTAKVDKRAPSIKVEEPSNTVTITAEDRESGLETVKYEWSTIQLFQNDDMTDYTAPFKYTGTERGNLYLHVSAEDKVGNEERYTKTYLAPVPPEITGERMFKDVNPRFGLKDDEKQYEKGYMYKIKINDDDWRYLDIDSTYEIKNPEPGTYTVRAKTIDTLGRESDETTAQLFYEETVPEPSPSPSRRECNTNREGKRRNCYSS